MRPLIVLLLLALLVGGVAIVIHLRNRARRQQPSSAPAPARKMPETAEPAAAVAPLAAAADVKDPPAPTYWQRVHEARAVAEVDAAAAEARTVRHERERLLLEWGRDLGVEEDLVGNLEDEIACLALEMEAEGADTTPAQVQPWVELELDVSERRRARLGVVSQELAGAEERGAAELAQLSAVAEELECACRLEAFWMPGRQGEADTDLASRAKQRVEQERTRWSSQVEQAEEFLRRAKRAKAEWDEEAEARTATVQAAKEAADTVETRAGELQQQLELQSRIAAAPQAVAAAPAASVEADGASHVASAKAAGISVSPVRISTATGRCPTARPLPSFRPPNKDSRAAGGAGAGGAVGAGAGGAVGAGAGGAGAGGAVDAGVTDAGVHRAARPSGVRMSQQRSSAQLAADAARKKALQKRVRAVDKSKLRGSMEAL